jgi:hypothetical protein
VKRSFLLRYGVAVLATASALVLRLVLKPALGADAPLLALWRQKTSAATGGKPPIAALVPEFRFKNRRFLEAPASGGGCERKAHGITHLLSFGLPSLSPPPPAPLKRKRF